MTLLYLESLDELQNEVVDLFSKVENKNVEIPEWKKHPYGPDQVKVSQGH